MTDLSLNLWLDSELASLNTEAALRVLQDSGKRESLKEMVYELLVQHPNGLTYDELWRLVSAIRPGTKEGTVRPRIVELRKEGRVCSSTALRTDTASHIPHLVWKVR